MWIELDNMLKANDTALAYTCPFPIHPSHSLGGLLSNSALWFPPPNEYSFSIFMSLSSIILNAHRPTGSSTEYKFPHIARHSCSSKPLETASSNAFLDRIMGVSSQPSPVPLSMINGLLRAADPQDGNSSYGYLWRKVRGMKHRTMKVLMKRRLRMMEGCRRRGAMGIKTRIRTLKRLIPRSNSESMGLDRLFRDTAEYILSLQTRVRIMQGMVDVLTASDK